PDEFRRGPIPVGDGWGAVVRKRRVMSPARKRSWWKRASWLIWCTIGPQINHEARINQHTCSEARIYMRRSRQGEIPVTRESDVAGVLRTDEGGVGRRWGCGAGHEVMRACGAGGRAALGA